MSQPQRGGRAVLTHTLKRCDNWLSSMPALAAEVPRMERTPLFALCLLAWTLFARTGSAQDATRLRICESTDQSCLQPNPNYAAEWSFDGTTGVVTSPAAESGTKLTIESMSQDKIVIHRVDPSGRSATYSG